MAIIKPGQLSSGSYSISGSFSGSFFGDGSNLANLPIPQIETGSFVTTSSFNAFTGSYNTGSFTGSFIGNGSGLTGVISSSFALTASYAVSASYEINYETSSSYAETASVAISASYAETASFVQNAQTASYVLNAVSSSFASTASYINPLNQLVIITGSLIQGLEGNIATGDYSHAEGSITKAIGNYSHAEGDFTQAKGDYSHAEGQETIASGSYSHAEGYGTIALGDRQHVTGQYNFVSSVPSAFIVGNGTDDGNRSNLIYAHDSTVEITGSLEVNGGITGSLQGTASWANNAISASFSTTASYALNNAGGDTFPYTGSANITGSLTVTGSIYTDSIIYSPFIISINFETLTSYTYKSPYSFKINSVESDPSGSITLSYVPSGSISSSNYIFGATINKFDSLTIIPLTSSLVILNSVRI
jgi:hypothetical protein